MRKTILILDDEQGLRAFCAEVLAGEGYRILLGKDGEEGLRLVRTARPDLVLSNVQMPKLDGVALTRTLRADAALDGMPIILMSGAATNMNDAPCDAYFEKPFQIDTLIATVARLLNEAREITQEASD